MPIRPYFPKVMYCINCTQYGHTKKHCSSSVRCCTCMGEHAEADCLEESNSCYRCKQPHDKISNCPKYIAKTKTVKQNLKKMHKQAYIESKKPLPAESITSEQNPIPSHRIVEVPTNTNVCKTTPAISRKQKKSNFDLINTSTLRSRIRTRRTGQLRSTRRPVMQFIRHRPALESIPAAHHATTEISDERNRN